MPVKVSCPKCSKELKAPDELVGQLVACPRCSNKFQISGVPDKMPATVGGPPLPPTAPVAQPTPSQSGSDLPSPVAIPPGQGESSLPPPPSSGGAQSNAANLDRISLGTMPPRPSGTAVPKQGGSATDVATQPQTSLYPPTANPAPPAPPQTASGSASGTIAAPSAQPASPPGQQSARFKGAPTTSETPGQPPATPGRKKREVKQAKFVASGAVSTKISLGEDGQLPDLRVADVKETTETKDEEQSSNPMLMIGVLIFSVVMSVVMLTVPDGSEDSESTSKQDAIEHIEEHYIGSGPSFKPYQVLLRDGIQAERRGDSAAAKAAFHRVLRMLRAETRGEMGLTAPKWADPNTAPNDRDLEDKLKVLLADG